MSMIYMFFYWFEIVLPDSENRLFKSCHWQWTGSYTMLSTEKWDNWA